MPPAQGQCRRIAVLERGTLRRTWPSFLDFPDNFSEGSQACRPGLKREFASLHVRSHPADALFHNHALRIELHSVFRALPPLESRFNGTDRPRRRPAGLQPTLWHCSEPWRLNSFRHARAQRRDRRRGDRKGAAAEKRRLGSRPRGERASLSSPNAHPRFRSFSV